MSIVSRIRENLAARRRRNLQRTRAAALYRQAVEQSRTERLYREFAVPDTLDGRFEMILLHVFLTVTRLRDAPETPARQLLIQGITEMFITDMDRNLREMGVTDTGVGKRVKRMTRALYGRLKAYDEALAAGELATPLARNVFACEDVVPDAATHLAAYALETLAALRTAPLRTVEDAHAPEPELKWNYAAA